MTDGRHHYGTVERLARDAVTLVCFCVDGTQCHRRILAEILAKCGAIDCGERE